MVSTRLSPDCCTDMQQCTHIHLHLPPSLHHRKWPLSKYLLQNQKNAVEWLILNTVKHADRRKHVLGLVIPETVQ